MKKKEHKPHVVYVLTKLELGGAQKVCLTLLKGVAKKTLTSSLISGTEGVLVEEAQKHESVYLLKSFRREVGIKTFFLEFAAFFQMISRMRKIKKQHKHVVVHTHSTKAGLMGRWAAFFAGIKKRVHTVHGFGFHEYQSWPVWSIHFILEYLTSLITTHYVCVSRADQKIGKKLLPRFRKKSSIIRAAVDWDTFYQPATKEIKPEADNFIFGTVSCLKPQKNLIDLLRAFTMMYKNLSDQNKKRVRLQIVGDGVERPKLEHWLKTHAMTEHVDLLGWQANVAEWMRSWNCFVMSSLWEGLPCAIVEARLSKLPVITYKIAGIPEVIKNKHNGFLVKAGDYKKLSQRMQALVEDTTLYTQMSNASENLFDFKNATMVEKHTKLYQKLF